MSALLQDLRYGWRSLLRTPAFTALVAGLMALGIGACAMVFGIVNGLYLKPYPYLDEDRVRVVQQTDLRRDAELMPMSYPDFRDLREHNRSFAAVVGNLTSDAYITIDREPERFGRTLVTPGFFAAVGVPLQFGREFAPEEERDGRQHQSVILSDRIWRERFGGDRGVLGRTITLNGRTPRVIGVAPPGFRYPEIADFFVPLWYSPTEDVRRDRSVNVLAVLRPGVTPRQAQAELDVFARDHAQRYPEADEHVGVRLGALRDEMRRDTLPVFSMLMAAVLFVLLIACANVANLLLVRGSARAREIGLRIALGATRWRIVRQLVAEGFVIAGIGAFFGWLLAAWGRDLMLSALPNSMPFWLNFESDGRTLAFLIGLSSLAAVLASLAPALQVSHASPHAALKDGGAHGTAGGGRGRMRNALVVAEIALAIVLLAGAGLFIRSFMKMGEQEKQVDTRGLVTARLTLPVARYPADTDRVGFFHALMPAIRAIPGVTDAAMVQAVPLSRSAWSGVIVREGVREDHGGNGPLLYTGIVSPGYFRTLGLALTRGRDFTDRDDSTAARVAIVNRSAAELLWPTRNPIGQRLLRFGDADSSWATVVGVVPDLRQEIGRATRMAQVFIPHRQLPVQSMTLMVRSATDPATTTTALRRLVQSRDPDLPLYDVRTMRESITFAMWDQRLYTWLMSIFAGLALLIAAAGIHGVMAYSVAQRTQEIGIRMALGAAQPDVVGMVVAQAARLTALGIVVGLAGAFAVTRLMSSLVFGVSTSDPPTFVSVALLLAASALVAAWIPARRATRVDPMVALRAE